MSRMEVKKNFLGRVKGELFGEVWNVLIRIGIYWVEFEKNMLYSIYY